MYVYTHVHIPLVLCITYASDQAGAPGTASSAARGRRPSWALAPSVVSKLIELKCLTNTRL